MFHLQYHVLFLIFHYLEIIENHLNDFPKYFEFNQQLKSIYLYFLYSLNRKYYFI
jgi:uncharacterized membrane protein YhdT